jgi:ribosomal protein L15
MKKSLLKRLPLQRGKGKFLAKGKPIIIKLDYLNLLKDGSVVDIDLLVKEGVVRGEDAKQYGVKILGGGGEFKKKFTVKVPTSKSAAKLIEKAGGKVEASK